MHSPPYPDREVACKVPNAAKVSILKGFASRKPLLSGTV